MNRHFLPSQLFLLLLTLILGQMSSFGQYYPPSVVASGLNSFGPITPLSGTGGTYSGGYYGSYAYPNTYQDGGYWNYSAGHEETTDQGFMDYSHGEWQDLGTAFDNGYYDGDGNWVSVPGWTPNWQFVIQPVWVPNLITFWVSEPVWVPSYFTMWVTDSAWMNATLSIDGSGNVTFSVYNSSAGSTSYWNGAYDFASGNFSGSLPTLQPANTDGSSWSPPPPPPVYPSFGPATIWVEGSIYNWSHTEFTDASQSSGTDYYVDGFGHAVWFQSANGTGSNNVGGTTSSGVSWTGMATNGIFESAVDVDVRAADSSGNYFQATAPNGLPLAVRVDGGTSLWNFIGQGSSLYHYAGNQSHQRLTIDSTTGAVIVQGSSTSLLYNQNVIWNSSGGRDVRAVSIDGHATQTDQSPSWGPPDVMVNQAVWRYVGTWDGSVSFAGSPAPLTGDHYLGDNNGQRLVVGSSGQVTVTSTGDPVVGTYARQGQQEGAPRVFTVSGYEIYPGDENGAYHKNQPAVGPPAIWVNGVTFTFASSNEDAGELGNWVDTYVDGDNNFLLVSATNVWAFRADGGSNWSGYYVPADSNLEDGGIFVVVNGSPRFDVRASAGVSLLPPQGSPLNGHPSVVKVNGVAWSFGGTASDTDYYFGSSPGERLWINADGSVSFTNTVNSPNLAGFGHLSGTIFLVEGHDLRACTSDSMPVDPVVSPQWGPAALWVEGVIWRFIGAVSDDVLNVHADYYGGINAGQVVIVDSTKHVAGAYRGVYEGGVFVVNDGADLRGLDATTGAQQAAVGTPVNGYPTSLRIGGLHWNFLGTYGGQNYYSAALGGQRMVIDANGAVIYSDHPHYINNATGTYADGVFTSTGGGMNFNAGTIGNDLDILGNIVSFGSLLGSSQTAGVTLQFMDDWNTATLLSALGRPQARWGWSRAATNGGSTAIPVMQLNEQGRLNLYDPATAATPQVEPTISLAPGVEAGVQASKLPRLELSQQTLDSDSSVLTKALGDSRYLRSSGDGQNLASLTVSGAANLTNATVSGSMIVAGSPVLTQSGADSRYLRNQASAPVVIVNGAMISGNSQLDGSLAVTSGATITGSTQLNGELNTTGNITSNANAEFKGDVVVESNLTVRGAYDGPATDRKVIMQAGKNMLIPESGDISMGSFRAGPLPETVANP